MMIAMSQALSVVRTARNREIAQNLLRRIDLDFPIEKIDYEERIESGEFDDPEGYYWTREILLIDEEERPGLFLREHVSNGANVAAMHLKRFSSTLMHLKLKASRVRYVNGVTSHTLPIKSRIYTP